MPKKIPLDTQYLLYQAQEHLIDYYQLLFEDYAKLKEVARERDENGFYSYVTEGFGEVMKQFEELEVMLRKVMNSKELNEISNEYLENVDDNELPPIKGNNH